jgi:hypothetical protein
MKLERSDVEFPIWRKKVDKSLFEYNGTSIPEWACKMWGLSHIYGRISSRKNPKSVSFVLTSNTPECLFHISKKR